MLSNSNTYRCTVISPDDTTREELARLLDEAPAWQQTGNYSAYPDSAALARMLRFVAPHLMVLDCRSLDRATEVIEKIRPNQANSHIVAICNEDVPTLARLMRLGVQDYITPTVTPEAFYTVLARAGEIVRSRPSLRRLGEIVSFLPAKAGSGATTIAVNMSAMLSSMGRVRTILADFDISGGTVGFLLKIASDHSIWDAMANIRNMDSEMWSRIKMEHGELDVLSSPIRYQPQVDRERLQETLQFLRESYDVVCVDLGPGLDETAIQILRESQRIFVVTTQELASQYMLCQKTDVLRSAHIEGDIKVILNRCRAGQVLDASRVEQMSDLKVAASLPNQYQYVNQIMEQGEVVGSKTALGMQLMALARTIAKGDEEPPKPRRRFLEMFLGPPQSESSEYRLN